MLRTTWMAILVAGLAGGALAATPQESLVIPPSSAPKAEEKAPPYYSRSNPFAPLPRPEDSRERVPAPPDEEASARPAPPPVPSEAQAPAAQAAPAVPKLNGILFSAAMPLAIINDSLVKAGEPVGEWRITSITPDTVTAEKEGVRYVMTPRRPLAQPQPAPPTPGSKAEPAEKAKTETAPTQALLTPAKGDPKP